MVAAHVDPGWVGLVLHRVVAYFEIYPAMTTVGT
jgi:hypothetical protein